MYGIYRHVMWCCQNNQNGYWKSERSDVERKRVLLMVCGDTTGGYEERSPLLQFLSTTRFTSLQFLFLKLQFLFVFYLFSMDRNFLFFNSFICFLLEVFYSIDFWLFVEGVCTREPFKPGCGWNARSDEYFWRKGGPNLLEQRRRGSCPKRSVTELEVHRAVKQLTDGNCDCWVP